MSDPVADKSGFLRMYMSSHPDTLVAYAKWFGKVTESITSAEMTSIDSKSMTLTCTLTAGAKKEVRIPIDPPLNGYDDVKPRLLEMKAIAQENLGMIKTPRITGFVLPFNILQSGLIVTTILYFALAPLSNPSPIFEPARYVAGAIGSKTVNYIAYTVGVAHILESLYTFTLCRKHQTGFLTGAAYVLSTFVFGFPIWTDFRKRVQSARINSVMKVE
ncbi:hypothetical protein Hypma_000356 [Hypsizygus marmoreus]|uniref:DUF2470 domain-containing protein n=1 Tax=Hypsizygus marmoreus TaxID=39966 RepID=A0A369JAM5_HYPMA|nr:hypothetical protein Hypma_000356 [Hypsizygus marmoreus]